MEFITLAVCMLDMSGVPLRFVLDPQGREVNLRKTSITGFASPDYEGKPCVKILVGTKTLFVLGPEERIRQMLEKGVQGR